MMNKLLLDLKYVFRLLAKSPAFSAISIVVVVMGLVLYLCSYTIVYNYSSKPLPYQNGDRFVAVKTTYKNSGASNFGQNFDEYAYNYLRSRVQSYETFSVYRYQPLTISDGDFPRQFTGAQIVPEAISMTKVSPLLGRMLNDSDALPGAQPVALLSFDVWQNYYAADQNIVGRLSRINGQLYTIVGVMPQKFDYPYAQDVWLPLTTSEGIEPDGILTLGAVGVLKPGVSLNAASAEIQTLVGQLIADYPEYYGQFSGAYVVPHSAIVASSSGLGDLLLILNISILALVALNLGVLLFFRAYKRQQELAVRYAVGANTLQIGRQILLESAVLCVIGLAMSLILADLVLYFVNQSMLANSGTVDSPAQQLSWVDLSIDFHAVGIAIITTALLWLVSGLWVAIRATKVDTSSVLASGGKGTVQSTHWITRIVVGLEITASCFLLIICSLVSIAIVNLYQIDFGTATKNYLTGAVQLRGVNYTDVNQRRVFLKELQRELSTIPEFQSASVTSALPGNYGEDFTYGLADRDLSQNNRFPSATLVGIGNNYFESVDVSILEGRAFDDSDTAESMPVVIIDELLAKRLWPGESAVGKQMALRPSTDNQWVRVIGVNSHIIQATPFGGGETYPALYRPLSQYTPYYLFIALQLAPGVTQKEATRQLQTVVRSLDRDLAVVAIQSLQSVVDKSHATYDFVANLATGFGLATFVFSLIGVYGLIARSVAERTHEIGIRKAIGSTTHKVLWLFLRQGLIYLVLGIVIGGAAALLTSTVLAGFINNLLDALGWVLCGVAGLMASMVLLASYLPARESAAMEPGDALRYE